MTFKGLHAIQTAKNLRFPVSPRLDWLSLSPVPAADDQPGHLQFLVGLERRRMTAMRGRRRPRDAARTCTDPGRIHHRLANPVDAEIALDLAVGERHRTER